MPLQLIVSLEGTPKIVRRDGNKKMILSELTLFEIFLCIRFNSAILSETIVVHTEEVILSDDWVNL